MVPKFKCHGEEVHVTSLRVFKTDKILSMQQKEGLFLFHVIRKWATLIIRKGIINKIIPGEKIRKQSFNFNLKDLSSKECIKRLSELALSKLTMLQHKKIISQKIFEYLNTFKFIVSANAGTMSTQTLCILVQIHTSWVKEVTFNHYNNCFDRPILSAEIDDDDDNKLLDKETVMGFRAVLIREARLKTENVEIDEELKGFEVEINGRWVDISDESKRFNDVFVVKVLGCDEENNCCPICLEDFLMGIKVAKAPKCSHLFHRKCLAKWLRKSNSCPLCRSNCIVLI